ncbi:MAG: ATP-binding protein [Usitatibacteraceae bacterium]
MPPPSYEDNLRLYTDESAAELDASVQKALLTGQSYRLDLERKSADGKRRWVSARGDVWRNADGEIIGLRGTVQNITRRKTEDAARASLEAQLRESQKMEAIGTLAGGIAHDFNNILATILGNTELARQDVSQDSPAIESLDEIKKAGSRARDLVRQILSFSRREPTARSLICLTPLIESSISMLRATLPARLVLVADCEPHVPLVIADATQVQQIIINLVTNAMQAMRTGPGRITIHLGPSSINEALAGKYPLLRAFREKHPGSVVKLSVTDDGPGMNAATLARVFEPFFTTKPVDEGTGLGLSVVHGIVSTHEGVIIVESEPGKGACFTVYLPAAEGIVASAPALPTHGAVPPRTAKGVQHILYIDDDESLVLLVKRLLERRGYHVHAYTDQQEALDALNINAAQYDLVVTDYNMPGLSGLDVARAVREVRAELPVVVASGFITEALREQATAAGVRELLFKANAVEDICDAIARMAQDVKAKSDAGI